jgi:glutaredoxin
VDQIPDEDIVRNKLKEKTGQTTFPYVYINKEFIGGNDKLQALDSNGKLD